MSQQQKLLKNFLVLIRSLYSRSLVKIGNNLTGEHFFIPINLDFHYLVPTNSQQKLRKVYIIYPNENIDSGR